jgi:hypothetical protein
MNGQREMPALGEVLDYRSSCDTSSLLERYESCYHSPLRLHYVY